MPTASRCPQCGASRSDAADGLCTACLLEEGLEPLDRPNLHQFRFQSPQFEFTAPTPWIFGNFDPGPNVGGTGTGVGDGYFLMVELPKGQHTIHFGGTYHFEAGELGNDEPFDLPHDITMEVTVGK